MEMQTPEVKDDLIVPETPKHLIEFIDRECRMVISNNSITDQVMTNVICHPTLWDCDGLIEQVAYVMDETDLPDHVAPVMVLRAAAWCGINAFCALLAKAVIPDCVVWVGGAPAVGRQVGSNQSVDGNRVDLTCRHSRLIQV